MLRKLFFQPPVNIRRLHSSNKTLQPYTVISNNVIKGRNMHNNIMPFNGNSANININFNAGGYPPQVPMMGGGLGYNDSSGAGMMQLLQMMMTATMAMLTYMMGHQSAAMHGGMPQFGGASGGVGNPGLGSFLGGGGNPGSHGAGGSHGSGGGTHGAEGAQGGHSHGGEASGNLVDLGGGHKVDASIAPQVKSMIAAAKKDGVDLKITSAHRSRAKQEELYAKYKAGTGNLAAKPGTSNHESGLAIDFTNTPGAYDWLAKNAGKFGLKNLPGEPWHYSTNGR